MEAQRGYRRLTSPGRLQQQGKASCLRHFRIHPVVVLATMLPSKEELVAAVREFYDSTNDFLFTTEPSHATRRRFERWDQWIDSRGPWYLFRDELDSALPDYSFGETYCSADGGPRCIVYGPEDSRSSRPDWSVVGCVSLLAPVYFVHGVEWELDGGRRRNTRTLFDPLPPHMARPAQAVAQAIEKMLGLSAFPRDWVETPVSLYAGLLEPSQTNLFHALFTNEPTSIP